MEGDTEVKELNCWIEEADDKIIHRVDFPIRKQGIKRFVVLSNDTDSFFKLLRYTPLFFSCGAQELWLQYGIGECTRMLPLHEISATLVPEMS